MKSFIVILVALFLSTNNHAQKNNPFLKLDFDKVVMYDFEIDEINGEALFKKNGQLADNFLKQVELDSITSRDFAKKLGDKKSFGGRTAACYEPHLGFVYFLKNKIVAHVTICMDCNRLVSSLQLPNQIQHTPTKEKGWFEEREGMSKTLLQFLNNLLKANGFSHQLPNDRLNKNDKP